MNSCEGGSCGSPDYQHLARTEDPREAEQLCAELESRGVPVLQSEGPRMDPSGTPAVDLYVAADRLVEAQQILAER